MIPKSKFRTVHDTERRQVTHHLILFPLIASQFSLAVLTSVRLILLASFFFLHLPSSVPSLALPPSSPPCYLYNIIWIKRTLYRVP